MSDRRILTVIISLVGLWIVLVLVGAFVVWPRLRHARPLTGPRNLARLARLPRVPTGRVDPGAGVYPGKPLPAGPKAYTARQFGQVCLSYYRKRGILAYQRFGHPQPAWNRLATDFLDRNAHYQAGVDPLPDPADLLEAGRGLLAAGCNDPVVLGQVGLILNEAKDWHGAEDCFERAVAGFATSTYPTYCRLGATGGLVHRRWRLMATEQARNEPLRRQLAAVVVAAAARNVFSPGEQRVFWNNVLGPTLEREFKEHEAELTRALQAQAATDPWLRHMALGRQSLSEGWRARGEGWAGEVPREAWPIFERGLQGAREHWEAAYKLHPEFPEAATQLITVAYAGQKQNPRVWFDRAVAAQLDYMQAYLLLTEGLLPRWGGNHEDLLRFAQECADSGRSDTEVPLFYAQIIEIMAQRDGLGALWQEPQVWRNVEAAYAGRFGYLQANRPSLALTLGTRFMLLAAKAEHLDSARTQLERMGGQVDHALFTSQSEPPDFVIARIYAASASGREALREAERLFQRHTEAKKVRGAFAGLLRREREPHVRRYLQDRLQTLRWEQLLKRGEWVQLEPTADLAGWETIRGTSTPLADGHGFQVDAAGGTAILACHLRPGLEYEVSCDVEVPAQPAPGLRAEVLAELTEAPEFRYDACGVGCSPPEGACWTAGGSRQTTPLAQVPQRFTLHLVKDGDRYTLRLNDAVVFQERQLGENGAFTNATVGFAEFGGAKRGTAVSYRNIRIRVPRQGHK